MNKKMTSLGFLGTGRITSKVVEGLCQHRRLDINIIISPRNKEKANLLKKRFSQVEIAAHNQEVVDNSSNLFIALMASKAAKIIRQLTFRKEQKILSFIPTITIEDIKKMVYPAEDISRVIPLPTSAFHLGPVLYYPFSKKTKELLSYLGNPLSVNDESQLQVLWAITGLISSYLSQMAEISNRCIELGVEPAISKQYTASMFQAVAEYTLKTGKSFSNLSTDFTTPGGLNEQAWKIVKDSDTFKSFIQALDAILERFPTTD